MIQAKELRFGNKVYNTRNAEIITVQQILHSTIIYDTQLKINKERFHKANRNFGADLVQACGLYFKKTYY